MHLKEVVKELNKLANPEKIAFKKQKFGVVADNFLGIYHKDLKELAKRIGKNSLLAIELFDSNIYEARLLCSKIFDTKDLTNTLIEKWVITFENWEICDSFCMGLFAKSEFAIPKILDWSDRENEFEKRAAFATMAAYCMADKKADNSVYENFFPIIMNASSDQRLYVKKAVNWALRIIGKRNIDLHQKTIEIAKLIIKQGTKSAIWIGTDAINQLSKPKVNILDYPRSIYRPKTER